MKYITKCCKCGCNNGVRLKFDNEDGDVSLQLVSDNFYTYQKFTLLEKLKRIWYIIINKEYCYIIKHGKLFLYITNEFNEIIYTLIFTKEVLNENTFDYNY